MSAASPFEAGLLPLQDKAALQTQWLELQQRADCSYFQSWGWIENWLQLILPQHPVQVLRLYHQQQLIALGVFAFADIHRRRLIHSRCLFLHEYPLNGYNMVIEYNGLLVARGHEQQAWRQLVDLAADAGGNHDEMVFGAVTDSVRQWLQNAAADGHKVLHNDSSPCYQAQLDFASGDMDAYLTTLSKNTREQIRRSRRLYQAKGELQLQSATSCEQALQWFSQMKQLHQSRWQSKGERGAFGNPRWEAFHRRLIEQRFDAGEVQMLRLCVADEVIACLYNHVWRGRVYVQQMGFQYEADNRIKPGYLAHALAIVESSRRGNRVYDFMHGEARYKRSLSHRSETLHWLVLQQPRWRFRLEAAAVSMVRRLRPQKR